MPSKLTRKALETIVAELRRRGVSEEQIAKMRVTALPAQITATQKEGEAPIKAARGSGGDSA